MSKEQTIEELQEEILALKKKVAKLEVSNALKSRKEENNKYSYILKNAKIISLEWDFTKDNIIWSEKAEEIMGFEKGAFGSTSQDFLNCLVPGDGVAFSQNLNCKITDGATECQSDFRMLKPNGEVLWMSGTSHLTYNEKNEPHILRGVVVDLTKYKKIELKYKEQSDFMRLLLDHMPQLIFWKDKNLRYQGCNEAFAQRKKIETIANVIGLTDKEIPINEPYLDLFLERDKYVLEHKKSRLDTYEKVKIDDDEAWFASSKIPIWQDKEVVGILGIIDDITAQKKAEEELRISEDRFKEMFYNSPVPLWDEDFTALYQFFEELKKQGVTDLDAYFKAHPEKVQTCCEKIIVKDVNNAVLKHYKSNDKQYFIGPLSNSLDQKALTFFRHGLIALFNGETEVAGESAANDFEGNPLYFFFKLSVTKDVESGIYKGFIANVNITEQTLAKQALADSEKRFRTIFEVSQAGIALINDHGIFQSANKALCDMLGFSETQLLTKSFLDVTHPEDVAISEKMVANSLKNKQSFTSEKRYVKPNGEVCWSLTSGSPIFTDNKLSYYVVIVHDITKNKIDEKAILKSSNENQKLAEQYKHKNEELTRAIAKVERSERLKSEFLQNLSHEIRTPMNSILGFTDFLDLDGTTAEKRKHFVKIIKNSGTQLLRIIDDILEISALETKHVNVVEEKFNLNIMLAELFSIYQKQAENKGLKLYLSTNLPEYKSIIMSDESKLRKIMTNLIENALRYTNSGSIEFGYKVADSDIEIFVKDTGIGISSERQDEIFERFSQAQIDISKKNGGLGLGLSIVKENAELLKGEVKLLSEENVGSTFSVVIPNCIEKIEPTNDSDKISILITEDEEVNYLYLSTVLEEINPDFEIMHAHNGIEAVEYCKNNTYDLIFMDIKMGHINGYEAQPL